MKLPYSNKSESIHQSIHQARQGGARIQKAY